MHFNKIGAKEPLNNKLLLLFQWTAVLMVCWGRENGTESCQQKCWGQAGLADTIPHPSDVPAPGGAR